MKFSNITTKRNLLSIKFLNNEAEGGNNEKNKKLVFFMLHLLFHEYDLLDMCLEYVFRSSLQKCFEFQQPLKLRRLSKITVWLSAFKQELSEVGYQA